MGYELNISCPNVKEGGIEFGVSCDMTEELTSKMRIRTDKLLIMKLSPNVTRIEDIAKASENGGADAVSAINTVVGIGININTRQPKLYTNYGGLSGPAIHPIAIANVHKISKAVSIPIIGIGGISNDQDVIEFLLAGSSFTQLGTINYKHPNLVDSIITNIENFMREKSIDNIKSIIGRLTVDD